MSVCKVICLCAAGPVTEVKTDIFVTSFGPVSDVEMVRELHRLLNVQPHTNICHKNTAQNVCSCVWNSVHIASSLPAFFIPAFGQDVISAA